MLSGDKSRVASFDGRVIGREDKDREVEAIERVDERLKGTSNNRVLKPVASFWVD